MSTEPHRPEEPNRPDADPSPEPPSPVAEPSPTRWLSWAWPIALVVAAALVYIAVRWGTSGTPPPVAHQEDVQASFTLIQAGRHEEAVATLKAVLAANPNSADAYNNLAVAYMGLQKLDDAAQAAREALRLRPDFELARNNLAWILREKAKASGLPIPPPASPEAIALVNESLGHAQARRFRECIDTATKATRLNPNSATAFNNIGFCSGSLGLWDEALRATQEALRLDPSLDIARNNLAWIEQERLKGTGSTKK